MLEFVDADTANRTPPPAFLSVQRRHGAQWLCELDAQTPALITWAAGQPLADLTIGPPDLASLFRQFYQSQEGQD